MVNELKTFSVGLLWALSVSVAHATAPAVTAVTPVEKLQAFPKEIFAQEGTAVLFTAKATAKNAKIALIQIDETGKPTHYIGIMTDDKTFGDRVRNDDIYSRKMEIKGRRGTILRFAVISDTGQITSQTFHDLPVVPATGPLSTQVEVLLRPTFVQLLQNVWDRLKNPPEQQPETATY